MRGADVLPFMLMNGAPFNDHRISDRVHASTAAAPQRSTHIELTAAEPRASDSWAPAEVCKLGWTAGGVRLVRLRLQQAENATASPFFHAGQWLDVAIPNVEEIGGFTLVGTPLPLPGALAKAIDAPPPPYLDLAIRRGKAAPCTFFTDTAVEGNVVHCRVGGRFVLDTLADAPSLLFLAGGVGLNPLYSFLLEMAATGDQRQVTLIHSAKMPVDFLFQQQLGELEQFFAGRLRVVHIATRDATLPHIQPSGEALAAATAASAWSGRITPELVAAAVEFQQQRAGGSAGSASHVGAALCGPPAFIRALQKELSACGLPPSRISTEKWT